MTRKFGKVGQMARVEKGLRNITLEDKGKVEKSHRYTKEDQKQKEHRKH